MDCECEPIGSPLIDPVTHISFYEGVEVNGITVNRKDCVKVLLEDDSNDTSFAYGQLLAIFDDSEHDDGVRVEIRWLLEPNEVNLLRKRRIESVPNELYESMTVDDIPAGSIIDRIEVKDYDSQANLPIKSKKRTRGNSSRGDITNFCCRFLYTSSGDTLLPILVSDMWRRGVMYSEYQQIYSNSRLNDESPSLEQPTDSETADPYSLAISQLHLSYVPNDLPCRQEEQNKIKEYLLNNIQQQSISSRSPLYLSGMPGTGKTATVLAVISQLKKDMEKGLVNEFESLEINGLRLTSPHDAYTLLWKGLSGDQVTAKTALARLKDYFNEISSPSSTEKGSILVCILDELDYLVTHNETIVYNFLEWSQQLHSGLIIIGIANTMDLPERLSKRAHSRMGGKHMSRLPFRPYSHDQISLILSERLKNLDGLFEKRTLEYTARKAAAYAGDLRSALKICQRAIEIHRDNQRSLSAQSSDQPFSIVPVTVPLVNRAAAEYRENPLMIATKCSCDLDISVFLAMTKHTKHTGMTGMTAEEIYEYTTDIIRVCEGMGPGCHLECPPWRIFQECLTRLVDYGLLSVTQERKSGNSSLYGTRLNHNDIIAALRDENHPMIAKVFPVENS